MLRLVLWCVVAGLAVLASPVPARAEADLLTAFDPRPLVPAELRLIQAALAATGDYAGSLDGRWTDASADALAAWTGRRFGEAPRNVHAGTLVLDFAAEIGRAGWETHYLAGLGLSLALPLEMLAPSVPEDGGERRWSRDGSLAILTRRLDAPGAAAWHRAAVSASADPAAFVAEQLGDRLVTAGRLRDGRRFYTRSDRIDGAFATVYLAAAPAAEQTLNLIATSIAPGQPLAWSLPEDGRLLRLVTDTETWRATGPAEPFVATLPWAGDMNEAPRGPATSESSIPGGGTGSGFYLGPRMLVTAGHVVADCRRVTLADGTPLRRLATDPDLDVAALAPPRPAGTWLSLSSGAHARLGQRVHAAGFPYYAIAGTSLHLTGGNVSALAGIDDDARFFSFTAPVQPGNSGGPLIDAKGGVLGLVVARLSEDFIVEETGSLPQNVNYALGEAALIDFLADHGLSPRSGGLSPFDLDEGAPDDFSAAIVPIVCH